MGMCVFKLFNPLPPSLSTVKNKVLHSQPKGTQGTESLCTCKDDDAIKTKWMTILATDNLFFDYSPCLCIIRQVGYMKPG